MGRTMKMTFVGDGSTYDGFVVYGNVEAWNYFVNTDISFDQLACPEGKVEQSKPVKDAKVRRYPGDPAPFTRPAIPEGRKVYKNSSKRSGGALPGYTFTMSTNPETWDGGDEKRQFQLVGNVADLAMYLKGDAEKDIILHTHTGTNYLICAAPANEG